ncbi:hypothetical protein [Methylibium sp.]|uniref:hypothetical protein n=1 Tax=Methylibium sp. TaxID=2067992 RepID=UPI003D0B031B
MSDDGKKTEPSAGILRFPQSRVAPPQTQGGYVELGITPLAQQLGLEEDQLNGHWCSRCRGIWYGYTLEAQCPRCGNRHG